MERFTISLDDRLATEFDALIGARGYRNRSEAVRDLLRRELDRLRIAAAPDGDCVASLSYVFDHHALDLAERITAIQHDHHDLTVSTMHVHLDHDHCLENVVLKGTVRAVRRFADAVCAERGVRHGQVNLISLEADAPRKPGPTRRAAVGRAHRHGSDGEPHVHLKPAT